MKNVLIIAHGNADVERGFSINSNIITENRALLSEASINGLRLVYDGVKYFGSGSAHTVRLLMSSFDVTMYFILQVPISSDMINIVKKSSRNYHEELMTAKVAIDIYDKQNNNESIRNERHEQLEKEKTLLDKQKALENQIKEAEFLIEEGTNRLEKALKNDVLSEAYAAKLLIVGGREKLTSVNEQQCQITNELDKLRLKRKDAFLHKQSTSKKLKSIQQL